MIWMYPGAKPTIDGLATLCILKQYYKQHRGKDVVIAETLPKWAAKDRPIIFTDCRSESEIIGQSIDSIVCSWMMRREVFPYYAKWYGLVPELDEEKIVEREPLFWFELKSRDSKSPSFLLNLLSAKDVLTYIKPETITSLSQLRITAQKADAVVTDSVLVSAQFWPKTLKGFIDTAYMYPASLQAPAEKERLDKTLALLSKLGITNEKLLSQ